MVVQWLCAPDAAWMSLGDAFFVTPTLRSLGGATTDRTSGEGWDVLGHGRGSRRSHKALPKARQEDAVRPSFIWFGIATLLRPRQLSVAGSKLKNLTSVASLDQLVHNTVRRVRLDRTKPNADKEIERESKSRFPLQFLICRSIKICGSPRTRGFCPFFCSSTAHSSPLSIPSPACGDGIVVSRRGDFHAKLRPLEELNKLRKR